MLLVRVLAISEMYIVHCSCDYVSPAPKLFILQLNKCRIPFRSIVPAFNRTQQFGEASGETFETCMRSVSVLNQTRVWLSVASHIAVWAHIAMLLRVRGPRRGNVMEMSPEHDDGGLIADQLVFRCFGQGFW
jgi:hypothetical protein